jgi:hypothetical protein
MVFKGKMNDNYSANFMDNFGSVDFAELNNLCMNDFNISIKKYLKNGDRRYKSYYKPGEVNNKYMEDYSEALQLFSNS